MLAFKLPVDFNLHRLTAKDIVTVDLQHLNCLFMWP